MYLMYFLLEREDILTERERIVNEQVVEQERLKTLILQRQLEEVEERIAASESVRLVTQFHGFFTLFLTTCTT